MIEIYNFLRFLKKRGNINNFLKLNVREKRLKEQIIFEIKHINFLLMFAF